MLESALKNALDGYVSRLDMAEEIIIKFYDMSIENSKTKVQSDRNNMINK